MFNQEIFIHTSLYCISDLVGKLFIGTIYLSNVTVSGFCYKNSSKIHYLVCSIAYPLKSKATNYK